MPKTGTASTADMLLVWWRLMYVIGSPDIAQLLQQICILVCKGMHAMNPRHWRSLYSRCILLCMMLNVKECVLWILDTGTASTEDMHDCWYVCCEPQPLAPPLKQICILTCITVNIRNVCCEPKTLAQPLQQIWINICITVIVKNLCCESQTMTQSLQQICTLVCIMVNQ
jgi:hypothetical protein